MSEVEEWAVFLRLLSLAPKGDRIEFGVLDGGALREIEQHPDRTYGVDSFAGMAEPTAADFHDGVCQYPLGRLATPMSSARSRCRRSTLIQGFVPDILPVVPNGPFAFGSVDMDQYLPTLYALEWLWPRMIAGGIIHVDDHFPDRDWLASRAINEFAKVHPLAGSFERRAWWVA
jgi:hypothetical protein